VGRKFAIHALYMPAVGLRYFPTAILAFYRGYERPGKRKYTTGTFDRGGDECPTITTDISAVSACYDCVNEVS